MSIYAIIGFLGCFGAFFLLEGLLQHFQDRAASRKQALCAQK